MSRDFHLFLAGQVTSTFGSMFTMIAIPLIAVRHLGATPAQMGMLIAATSLPLVVFGLLISAWVDRLPRRRPYLIACELTAAAATATVLLALVTGRLTLWGLTAFVMVLGILGVIAQSAYFVHLRSLVPSGELVRARAALQGAEQAGGVLGRILSGPVTVIGTFAPFLVDFISYLVSAVCLISIREPEPVRRAAHSGRVSLHELGAGLRLLRDVPFLRRITPFVASQQIVNGMVLALLAPFLLTVLDVPTALYGLLFVLSGVAVVAGATVTARLAGRVDARALAIFGFLGVSVTTPLLAFAGGSLPIAAVIAALGIGLPYLFGAIGDIGLTAFVTDTVPEEKLGRASASLQLIAASSLVIGSLMGGQVAELIGIRPALWVAAAISAVTIVALRAALRAARRPGAGEGGEQLVEAVAT